jgi:hypothetical protein
MQGAIPRAPRLDAQNQRQQELISGDYNGRYLSRQLIRPSLENLIAADEEKIERMTD